MNRYGFLFILLFFVSVNPYSRAQNSVFPKVDNLFMERGEVYFKFSVTSPDEINSLTHIISIDKVNGNEVFAYANKKGFIQFRKSNHPYKILPAPGLLIPGSELTRFSPFLKSGSKTVWNFYPTYEQFLDYMVGFAAGHPDICNLDTIGTSVQGRLLLAVKISDNVHQQEAEPRVLYTAAIHGDETGGYVLMLHLIDYLLLSYGSDQRITDLINSTEIFINPLANPDGTYFGGNNSVFGATRYNANFIDLNRNYPDPKLGLHPDNEAWQPETMAFMTYGQNNHFTLSANFHGGSEVFNYPWDTWEKLTPDDSWWQFVGRQWADTAQKYGSMGYFTDVNNGITNGHAWYEINGGRQDYMNYWHHCREATVEISNIKLLPTNQLDSFWLYNYTSFLNYIEQSHFGVNGLVTDSITGQPVFSRVFINNHDEDSSDVFSYLPSGFFARPVFEGTYDITFSSPSYFSKTFNNVVINNGQPTTLNVQMKPYSHGKTEEAISKVMIYPNPGSGIFKLMIPFGKKGNCIIKIMNGLGKEVYSENLILNSDNNLYNLNLNGLSSGLYFFNIISQKISLTDKLIICDD
ncbi:MAG: T9SS type A sorting domain-containing protein [Bacteroidales bacterium]|jgi:hypothetical protein|nr:T9SS type A sorting domain-containing protein [Bacteroidales bacterium]